MKKIIGCLIVVLSLICLSGCGSKEEVDFSSVEGFRTILENKNFTAIHTNSEGKAHNSRIVTEEGAKANDTARPELYYVLEEDGVYAYRNYSGVWSGTKYSSVSVNAALGYEGIPDFILNNFTQMKKNYYTYTNDDVNYFFDFTNKDQPVYFDGEYLITFSNIGTTTLEMPEFN